MKGRLALFVLCCVLAGLGLVLRPALDWRFDLPDVAFDPRPPAFETVFDYTSPVGTAHAPAIDVTEDGFDLIWFDGLRESSNDTQIFRAHLQETATGWQADTPAPVFSRQSLSTVMMPPQTVLTLGNSVEFHARPGDFLATIVSVGGWAMSSVAAVDMENGVPVFARKLDLSPLLNRSYLVKSPMVDFADGIDGLPVYFELGNTYGALARVDRAGRVRGKSRMVGGVASIQPMIVMQDTKNAVALLRNFDHDSDRLLAAWTTDGGQSWSRPAPLALPNPNSPVAALGLPDGRILMAFNDHAQWTDTMRLALSSDGGRTWTKGTILEQGAGAVRYPMMRYLPDGRIALTYSVDGKTGIRAHVFTQSWAVAQ
jgi:predicted neuraminidase